MKQSYSKFLSPAEANAQFTHRTLRATATALLVFGLVLFWLQPARAQQETRSSTPTTAPITAPTPALPTTPTKADLEYQKLELEIAKLQQKDSDWTRWLPILAFIGAAAGTLVSLYVAHRARAGAIDQATHQKRLNSYPELIKASAPLALYFPEFVYSSASLNPDDCRAMGRQMSRWYFDGGGLLLSVPARDAYFNLARELTRASFATELRVPNFRHDAKLISREQIDDYAESLGKELERALKDLDTWKFEGPEPKEKTRDPLAFRAYVFLTKAPGLVLAYPARLERRLRSRLRAVNKQTHAAPTSTANRSSIPNHERFKDYIFLQHLSSLLRTALADDLRSRRRLS